MLQSRKKQPKQLQYLEEGNQRKAPLEALGRRSQMQTPLLQRSHPIPSFGFARSTSLGCRNISRGERKTF